MMDTVREGMLKHTKWPSSSEQYYQITKEHDRQYEILRCKRCGLGGVAWVDIAVILTWEYIRICIAHKSDK